MFRPTEVLLDNIGSIIHTPTFPKQNECTGPLWKVTFSRRVNYTVVNTSISNYFVMLTHVTYMYSDSLLRSIS